MNERRLRGSEVTFYFDLGSPYAYLAAERLERLLPEPVRWQPVLLGGLFKLTGRSSWALGDYRRRQSGMAEIERRAARLRAAADALAGPVAQRLPGRDARGHVCVHDRAWACSSRARRSAAPSSAEQI